MKKMIIGLLVLQAFFEAIASDTFPIYERKTIEYLIPTNTPYCVKDTNSMVGTNYIYKLEGQIFPNSSEGHIQTLNEGFDGKTDERTPWKTLTELLAAYQKGSSENEIRALYANDSKSFLDKVYGNEKMKERYKQIGMSIVSMDVVSGYDYRDGFLSNVRLVFADGHQEISQFYFVRVNDKYKIASLKLTQPDPLLMNVGLYLNRKVKADVSK